MPKPKFFARLAYAFFKPDYYRYVVASEPGFGLENLLRALALGWLLFIVEAIVIATVMFFVRQEALEASNGDVPLLLRLTVPFLASLVLLVLAVFFSLVLLGIQVFVFAVVGRLFNFIFKTRLTYQQLCRVTAAALAPVIVLGAVFGFWWNRLEFWGLHFLLTLILTGYGVLVQKKKLSPSLAQSRRPPQGGLGGRNGG